MEFYLPFHDPKRAMLDNEKQVQIVNDIYRIRTLTDTKDADGRIVTQVYAEAAFYDLSFSEEKETVDFNADTADAPMRHALEGTGWSVGRSTSPLCAHGNVRRKTPFPSCGPRRISTVAT